MKLTKNFIDNDKLFIPRDDVKPSTSADIWKQALAKGSQAHQEAYAKHNLQERIAEEQLKKDTIMFKLI